MKGFLKKKKDQSEQADMELELINLDETSGWSRLEVAHELKRQEAAEGERLQADVEMAEELCPEELPERMKTMILTEEAEPMEAAEEGDIVLLSPACAAFDRFSNFAERGRFFKKIVMELK